MMKDQSERRAYRKSPGRQYGYDYDPLHSQNPNGYSQSGRLDTSTSSEQWPDTEDTTKRNTKRPSGALAPRPDPRRTRQLMRQSILASKSRSAVLEETRPEQDELQDQPINDQDQYEDLVETPSYSNRYGAGARSARLPAPNRRRFADLEEEELHGEWPEREIDDIDPDLGYEDPLERRLGRARTSQERLPARPSDRYPPGSYAPAHPELENGMRRSNAPVYDEEDFAEDQPPTRRRAKQKGLSRRKLLIGAVAVGGTAFAAYELGPKIPQTLQNVGTNIEHQLQDSFNKGFNAGAEAVRKEFINALDSVEGISLDAAIGAARLTRVAYDVFVSPLLGLAATITGDFLTVTLRALISARGWLKYLGQDNATMAALQSVLESWTKDVSNMPQKLQAVTDADLDGAQSYLRGVQRTIQQEQAKLNAQQATPTPRPTSTPKPH